MLSWRRAGHSEIVTIQPTTGITSTMGGADTPLDYGRWPLFSVDCVIVQVKLTLFLDYTKSLEPVRQEAYCTDNCRRSYARSEPQCFFDVCSQFLKNFLRNRKNSFKILNEFLGTPGGPPES